MAGDVPVWPDNMALMTVKGGCLQGYPVSRECTDSSSVIEQIRKEEFQDPAELQKRLVLSRVLERNPKETGKRNPCHQKTD